MALTRVTRHLGLLGLSMLGLGCTDDVELLSSFAPFDPAGAGIGPMSGKGGRIDSGGAGGFVGKGGGGGTLAPDGGTGAGSGGMLCNPTAPVCEHAWSARAFVRGGCVELLCAPPSACHGASDCGAGETCYAGAMCEDGCAPGNASCCEGNFCALEGCDPDTVPLSCTQRGCPLDQHCDGPEWARPDCACAGGVWLCRTPPPSSQCL